MAVVSEIITLLQDHLFETASSLFIGKSLDFKALRVIHGGLPKSFLKIHSQNCVKLLNNALIYAII